jgi:tRNA threonylcarbamoyladenosine biosynthesis protein TsaB
LFVAARGPGSFTGLRIGLAAVESLAFATGGKARAISTLTALAWTIGPSPSLIAPVFDARRHEVHGALYRRREDDLEELRSPRTEAPQVFLASLPSEPLVLCGPGTTLCTSDSLPESWEVNDRDAYLAPAIADMAAAGHEEPFEPLYLRAPAVQPASGGKGG